MPEMRNNGEVRLLPDLQAVRAVPRMVCQGVEADRQFDQIREDLTHEGDCEKDMAGGQAPDAGRGCADDRACARPVWTAGVADPDGRDGGINHGAAGGTLPAPACRTGDKMTAALCVPCEKGLEETVKLVRLSGRQAKDTCRCCRKRRFCGLFDANYNEFRRAAKRYREAV